MGFNHLEEEAVLRVMRSGTLSGYMGNIAGMYGGKEVQALEREWAEYFGVKHAIACNSATSGLWCALNSIGLLRPLGQLNPISDEVIVTPYSMTCSASLPILFGANPVFADIEPDYFCLDPKNVESKITAETKAIIVVDLFGQPYDADAINEIAERKGKQYGNKIYVIEDVAQAIGAKYKGRYTGTLGDIGVFSLNFHKHIHCGEGGMIVTNDNELAFKIRLSMNHAEAIINDFKRNIDDISSYTNLVGMNLRMTEIQAAIARVQLTKLNDILKVYREDAKYFDIKVRPDCEHSYYRYAWKTLDDFENIEIPEKFNLKKHYIKPIYKMPLFKELGYPQNLCKTCEQVEGSIILAWHKEMP